MEINNELILKLEKLSRLELSESERKNIQKDLNGILQMVDKLNELDTQDVEPLVYIGEEVNVLRADEVGNEVTNEQALLNAPESEKPYFTVPKMIRK